VVGDVDEDEADRNHMAEIQCRIEARKAARDLEIARSTMRDLKESGSVTSATLHKSLGKKAEREKQEGKKKGVNSRVVKKPSATQTAAEATLLQSIASTDAMPTESFSEVVAIMGTTAALAPKRVRSTRRENVDRRPDDALSTLKFGALDEIQPRSTEPLGDVLGAELGIKFVASALGKAVPRTSSEDALIDMPDCYVEMTSTRKKAKMPVSVAPPNSIDSDVDRDDTGSEIPDVHIEIPGEVKEYIVSSVEVGREAEVVASHESPNQTLLSPRVEIATISPEIAIINRALVTSTPNAGEITSFCDAVSSVEPTEGKVDTPLNPFEYSTPVNKPVTVIGVPSDTPRSQPTPTVVAALPGSEGEKNDMRAKYEHRQRIIREIAAAQLLQEEIKKNDQNLASVASFLKDVCGANPDRQKVRDAARLLIRGGIEDDEPMKGSAASPHETTHAIEGDLSRPMITADGDPKEVVATEGSDAGGQKISETIASEPEQAVLVVDEELGAIRLDAEFTVERVVTQGPDESDMISFPDTKDVHKRLI